MSAPPDALVFFTDRNLGRQFPAILTAAGLSVRRHSDHFAHDCSDDVWLETVAKNRWIAITHDARIRYKPNELAAVVRHEARLLIVVGKAPYPELAKNVVATSTQIEAFVAKHNAPWIGRVYRPTKNARNELGSLPGRVELWYPRTEP